jgi:hypothetical protein
MDYLRHYSLAHIVSLSSKRLELELLMTGSELNGRQDILMYNLVSEIQDAPKWNDLYFPEYLILAWRNWETLNLS